MKFSGATVIKIVTEETPYELSTWNFDIVIFVCVCHESVNCVPQGIILSQQGVICSVVISNISLLSTKGNLMG